MSSKGFTSRRKFQNTEESSISLSSHTSSQISHGSQKPLQKGSSRMFSKNSQSLRSASTKDTSNAVARSKHHTSTSHSIVVIDPLDNSIRNPVSLSQSHKHDHHDTNAVGGITKERSMSSMNSGRASPTMSEVSEAVSTSFSSSFRMDSSRLDSSRMDSSFIASVMQTKSDQLSQSARTGASSPSTYMSEEEFLFQSPAVGFQDDSSVSIGETQSVIGEAKDLKDEYAQSIDDDMEEEEEVTNDLTPAQVEQLMNQDFVVNLTETPTLFFFDSIDVSVPNDASFHDEIILRNREYLQLKEQKISNKDSFGDRDMQTISVFNKNKYSDIPKQEISEQSVSVAAWEIFDEYEAMRELEEKAREELEQLTVKQDDEDEDEDEDEEEEQELDENGSQKSGPKSSDKSSVLKLPKFKQSLMIMERLIVQNTMIRRLEDYRRFKDLDEDKYTSEGISKPNELKLLWKYNCELTQGQNVNCMCWNDKNPDMLAAGYGNIDFVGKKEGAICIWMLKNPRFPERYIPVENKGVSSIDFSKFNPSLLSVGYNDGTVAIFDIRRSDTTPVLETSKHHTGTVWDIQWVDRGKDLGERFHSVGVDGRVNCWSIKKGLECQQIMRLKRQDKGEGVLSRESGGMCIDFDPHDSNLYIVGTEDGTIYKCSTSYNEQYLQTFQGHTGPVYRLRWNPFDRDSFISCSADWTIRIWNTSRRGESSSGGEILKIEPYQNKEEKRSCVITDVQWSPYLQNVFASTSITGDIELWDINHNSMKPRYSKSNPNVQYNCLQFATNSPAILVGDNQGNIEVLKPIGLYQ